MNAPDQTLRQIHEEEQMDAALAYWEDRAAQAQQALDVIAAMKLLRNEPTSPVDT